LLWLGGAGLFVAGLLLGYVSRPRPLPPMAEEDPVPAAPAMAAPPRAGAGEPTPIRRVAAPTAAALLALLAAGPAWS
ncbi:hypothetical protein ABTB19_21335, partial [Acinetobacter baumannii]